MRRRTFLRDAGISALAAGSLNTAFADKPGRRDGQVEVLNPIDRVPVSFIIDDSTALVNLAHYGIPQFGEVFPDKYRQDWRSLPREIPDAFVKEFLEWCDLHRVKGKYSMVPYPACTGWLHRFIPGWSKTDLQHSLDIVRNDMANSWDIHPEMISHTRVIDVRTGLPYPEATPQYMENWEWSQDKSADELASYITYALNVLKEAGLYCEGVTTPGGFCHRNKANLAIATMEAVQAVYKSDVAHFFRDIVTESGKSVAPVVMHQRDLDTANPSCSVHIIGCTDDWFGDWDGIKLGDRDRFITADLNAGRMVEVIDSGEPAIMVCHWPGLYFNGEKRGFKIFQDVVVRLEQKYGMSIRWMKVSEIARYWAAKAGVSLSVGKDRVVMDAPFGTDHFTIRTPWQMRNPRLRYEGTARKLTELAPSTSLQNHAYLRDGRHTKFCFHLPRGRSELIWDA